MIYEPYNNLRKELEICEKMLDILIDQKNYLDSLAKVNGPSDIKGIDYSTTPVQSSGQIEFMYYLERVKNIEYQITLHKQRIERIKTDMKEIEGLLSELKGVHYDVCYKMYVEGKTQAEIALELNYSKRQIERISAQLNNNVGEMSV